MKALPDHQNSPSKPSTKGLKPHHVLRVIIGLLVFGLIFFILFPPHVIYSERDFSTAKQKLNPENLRRWALEMTARYIPVEESIKIPVDEVPDEIKTAFKRPPSATVSEYGDLTIVKLHFGGGFAHWFIAVGSTNFSWPDGGGFYRSREWISGIYFVREGNR